MLGNGVIRTIEDDRDIYISLTQLCEYFTQSLVNIQKEVVGIDLEDGETERYSQGLVDMMLTVTQEFIELGKFEAQRRMIDTPQDLLDMLDKKPFGKVE